MRTLCIASLLLLTPALSSAQDPGTIELTSVTTFVLNKQTLTNPEFPDNDLDVTQITTGVDMAYYLTPRFGVGPFLSHITFKLESGGTTAIKTSAAVVGGMVKLRFNSGRTGFFVQGGAGMTRTNFETGGGPVFNHNGYFYVGGGGVSFWLNDYVTLDGGVRYQGSAYRDEDAFDLDTAGLFAALTFSIFIR
jgi:hypothetical protein